LLESLPQEINYAVELQNDSWFQQNIIKKFADLSNIYMVLSYRFGYNIYYPENQKIHYLRMIGDIKLTVFNKIQRNEVEAFDETVHLVKKYRKSPEITDIFVIFSNISEDSHLGMLLSLKKELDYHLKNLINKKTSLIMLLSFHILKLWVNYFFLNLELLRALNR